MQDNSAGKNSISERLDRLRVASQLTWAEVGKAIGLSESMIYQIKSGKKQLSTKGEYRLALAERDLGLAPPLTHDFARAKSLRDKLEVIRRASEREALQLAAPAGRQAIIEGRVEYLLEELEPFLIQVESLAEMASIGDEVGTPEFLQELKRLAKSTKSEALRLRSRFLDLTRLLDAIQAIEEA